MTSSDTEKPDAPDEAVAEEGAGSDAGLIGGPPGTQMRRLHPLTPFLRSWRLIGGVSAVAAGIFRDDLNRVTWVWHAVHGDLELTLLGRAALITLGVAVVLIFGGWLSWRATGFAIVDDQAEASGTLLFHRGVLAKQRNQVRLKRVQSVDVNQPLVPRLLGLAAVRLDMAAGDEASVDLAYLRLDDAVALRTEILRHTSVQRPAPAPADGSAGPVEPALQPDVLIAQVSTEQVIKSNLLDGISAWVVFLVWVVAAVVAPIVIGWTAFLAALSGLIPVTIAIVAQLRRQVVSMLRDADFKLYRTPTGIRVSSGLTSTVNRTVDFDRIQGVRLVEPFWWRRFGWARVKLDIAGGRADFDHGASLIPVADRAKALELIAAVIGPDIDGAPFTPVGDKARLVDPIGWRFLGVGSLESGVVSRAGRWRRSTAFVPYARVQSVSAQQGLLQRRLGLATVFLDLPKGSRRWEAKHRGVDDAAKLVVQLGAQARLHRAGDHRGGIG